MSNELVLESFISFCDNMMIAEEGLVDKFKSSKFYQILKAGINKIVQAINFIIRKIQEIWNNFRNKNKETNKNDEKTSNNNDIIIDKDGTLDYYMQTVDHFLSIIPQFCDVLKQFNIYISELPAIVNDSEDDEDKYYGILDKITDVYDNLIDLYDIFEDTRGITRNPGKEILKKEVNILVGKIYDNINTLRNMRSLLIKSLNNITEHLNVIEKHVKVKETCVSIINFSNSVISDLKDYLNALNIARYLYK